MLHNERLRECARFCENGVPCILHDLSALRSVKSHYRQTAHVSKLYRLYR